MNLCENGWGFEEVRFACAPGSDLGDCGDAQYWVGGFDIISSILFPFVSMQYDGL